MKKNNLTFKEYQKQIKDNIIGEITLSELILSSSICTHMEIDNINEIIKDYSLNNTDISISVLKEKIKDVFVSLVCLCNCLEINLEELLIEE